MTYDGNLISSTKNFHETSLLSRKFTLYMRSKALIYYVQQDLTCIWNQSNGTVVLHSLASLFLGRVRKTDFFQSSGQIFDFQTLLHNFCKTIATELSACFKISPGMSSIPGAFWFFNFLMATWTFDRRISGSSSPQGGNFSDVSLVSSWDTYRFSQ